MLVARTNLPAPHSRLARSTLIVKDRIAFPPERCVFSPEENLLSDSRGGCPHVGLFRPRNPSKLSRSRKRRQPAKTTGFPPVFNSSGSFHPSQGCVSRNSLPENSLQRTRKRSSAGDGAENTRTPKSGRCLNNKDRLEVLLFAETLQGTLSPNANP